MLRRTPLLGQVRDELLALVRNGGLGEDQRLPSETAMAARLGVSRATIREAYVQLEAEGLLARRHGVGTFFRDIPIRDDQNIHATFPRAIRAAGMTPAFRLLRTEEIAGDEAVRAHFSAPPGARYHVAERLVLADSRPAVHLTDFVPVDRFDGWADLGEDDVDMILYLQRKRLFGEAVIHTEVRAAGADAAGARHLELPVGAPAFFAEATIEDAEGAIVVYSRAWYRADLIAIRSTRRIPAAAGAVRPPSAGGEIIGIAVAPPGRAGRRRAGMQGGELVAAAPIGNETGGEP